ncbi:MAG: hypothetical protein IIA62_07160 [Nitrospinae bacterium]|nr:hypothetical protein [Nitrospinota bacterium]
MIIKMKNQGFKDQDRYFDLSGLDLFTSNNVNGVGKSAALEAFKLGLLGKIPGRAKCLDDILSFTSRDELSVRLFAQTARGEMNFERRFLHEAEKGEKRPVLINGVKKNFEEANRFIESSLGAVSVSFDPHEFLGLSDNKKKEWIVERSPESFCMSREGLRFLILARLAEKYFGCGALRDFLRSQGVEHLPSIPAAEWYRDVPPLLELIRDRDPILCASIRETMERVFSFWPDSSTEGDYLGKMLGYVKSETVRLNALAREQSAAIDVLRKDAFMEGIFTLDKKIESARRSVSDFDRRLFALKPSLSNVTFHYMELSELERYKKDLEEKRKQSCEHLETLLRNQGKLEILQKLELRQRNTSLELELIRNIFRIAGPEGVQGEMASRVAVELEKKVNDILRLMDPGYEFTMEVRGGTFAMGWRREGKVIPFSAINSAHFVLFIVPFLTALINRLALVREREGLPTLRALCIEAGPMSPHSVSQLLEGLAAMREKGLLDNVLVAHYRTIGKREDLHGFREHVLFDESNEQGGSHEKI